MKLLCLLLYIAYADCFHNSIKPIRMEKIEGGRPTVTKHERPFQASLEYRSRLKGSASIIAKLWLLSAMLCFKDTEPKKVKVRIGTTFTQVDGTIHKIRRIEPHPLYDPETMDNDIVLILLDVEIELKPGQLRIALAYPDDIPKVADIVTISGYGKESFSATELSPDLKIALVRVIKWIRCYNAYKNSIPISQNMFCSLSVPNSPCIGDTGGPVTFQRKLIGVIVTGGKCADPSFPAVYMKIGSYYDWIINKTNLPHEDAPELELRDFDASVLEQWRYEQAEFEQPEPEQHEPQQPVQEPTNTQGLEQEVVLPINN